MLRGKTTAIFDLDGTLIDSVGIWNDVDARLLRELGAEAESEAAIQSRRDAILAEKTDADPYLVYCARLKEFCASPFSAEEIHALRYTIARGLLENEVDYKPGAARFLSELRACGFQLAIASTTRRRTVDIYRTLNRRIVGQLPFDGTFDLILAREDVVRLKPDPEIYLKAMDMLAVSPRETIIFEDSLVGVLAARAAGVQCIAVYDRHSDADRNRIGELSDARIANWTEALALLPQPV